jgi:hypothetical protein
MLQHEPQEQAAATPAAHIRVTSEELAQAINALEASKDEAARHLAGTVPIGEVVQELKLEATPEEVWVQVQKQRARLAVEPAAVQAAAEAKVAKKQAMRLATIQALPRPRQRRRGRWWMILGIGWVVYGVAHGSLVHMQKPSIPSSQGIVISGDNQIFTADPTGKNVEVRGDKGTITLNGNCPWLIVNGDHNLIRVKGVTRLVMDGGNNTVIFSHGPAPTVSGDGNSNGNKIEQAGP